MRARPSFYLFLAGGIASIGHLSGPSTISAAEKKLGFSDFGRTAVPFLTKHCVGCHGAVKPKAEMPLHIYKDDASVLQNRKVWKNVLDMVQSQEMPPRGKPKPSLEEIDEFVKAVTGVFARADAGKRDPGRVTMRRLNRTEYNNTIRDLVGVDFQPAEDFPTDDVGYGFDNIGDVLTLSPLLMERYLAAAETIMQRAITPNPPPTPKRHLSAKYSEPAGGNVPQGRFRPISTKPSKSPVETGPLNTPYQVPADGEYIFRTRVYATTEGKEPVRVAILAFGKNLAKPSASEEIAILSGLAVPKSLAILKTVEIKARTEKTAEVIEVKIAPGLNFERLAVGLVKSPDGKPLQTLHVEYLALEGPLDTRPASHRRIMETKSGLDKKEAARVILTRFASKAFRRPADKEEVDRLLKLVDQVESRDEKWEAGIQLALQAVLCSPKFLFRIELDQRSDSKDPYPITDHQLASRLSYFLWSTMPDDELFALAEKKALHQNLEGQVKRMLADPRATALVENFAVQWLQLRLLKNVQPDAKLFPEFDEPLRKAMLKETELFFEAIVREDRSVLDLIDGNFTFLNERLSRHYGIADTNGNRLNQKKTVAAGSPIPRDKFVRVKFADGERGGLLTHASVLTITSNPTRTSPVKRGRWVLEQILGTPPPPPPENVPELPADEKAQLTGSLRKRMEQHRSNPSCANCHARMDPIGFAFENYNAVGKFRLKDGNFAIDPSGTLPDGKSFQGARELKAILKGKKDLFGRCLTDKMLTYALGRGLEYYDKRAVDKIIAALEQNNWRFSTLILETARSDPFRMRRGKD